jgi:abhydrolase domain-containing protein 12
MADNETLSSWFTFSDPFYAAHKADLLRSPSSSNQLIRTALRTHPTVLFLHGNGTTRMQHYQAFASHLRANVFVPDYRSFGDSESMGTPSEAGLILDARATWDQLRSHGAPPESVLVVGNSLGTVMAVQLVSALEADQMAGGGGQGGKEEEGAARKRPCGVVLLAPFTTVATLLDMYSIAGLVPLLRRSGLSLPLLVSSSRCAQ